jgi:hypothetical protein
MNVSTSQCSKKYDEADTNQFFVQDSFVQFTKQFRYLWLVISYNLWESADVKDIIGRQSEFLEVKDKVSVLPCWSVNGTDVRLINQPIKKGHEATVPRTKYV